MSPNDYSEMENSLRVVRDNPSLDKKRRDNMQTDILFTALERHVIFSDDEELVNFQPILWYCGAERLISKRVYDKMKEYVNRLLDKNNDNDDDHETVDTDKKTTKS